MKSAFRFKYVLLLSGLYSLLPELALAQKAPVFKLDSDQGIIALSQLKNRVVYIDFWASWCKPCRQSFPFMNELHTRYNKQGLVVIAINLDEQKKQAALFLQKHPASFLIAYDINGETAKQYGLTVMPSSWIIDRKGNIISHTIGFKEADQAGIESTIQQALASKR